MNESYNEGEKKRVARFKAFPGGHCLGHGLIGVAARRPWKFELGLTSIIIDSP